MYDAEHHSGSEDGTGEGDSPRAATPSDDQQVCDFAVIAFILFIDWLLRSDQMMKQAASTVPTPSGPSSTSRSGTLLTPNQTQLDREVKQMEAWCEGMMDQG